MPAMKTPAWKITKLLLIILICFSILGCGIEEMKIDEEDMVGNVSIIDIYDNIEFDPRFKVDFGFGCVIKLGRETILFDSGSDSKVLLENLKLAGIKPKEINIVVLSHEHQDHTGGILGFLEKNPSIKIYVPESFSPYLKNEIASKGAEIIEVSKPIKITKGVYSTGQLGSLVKEQSLVINSKKGLIIVTGCAHPGITNIVKKAKELFKKEPYLVIGGFHHPPISVVEEFRKLNVKKVAPSHCSGSEIMEAFERTYQKDFIKSGVGKIIKI